MTQPGCRELAQLRGVVEATQKCALCNALAVGVMGGESGELLCSGQAWSSVAPRGLSWAVFAGVSAIDLVGCDHSRPPWA
jgi:hypothetical protein